MALVMMSAIGDVVHALPLANSLRAAAPGMHLSWVIQPVPQRLLAEHPVVDEFLPFHRKRGWRAYPEFYRSVRSRAFDLVLDPHVYFKAGVVTGLLKAPRKVGFDRGRAPDLNWLFSTERLSPRPRAHVQDEILEFVDYLGIPRVLEWGLGSTPEERVRYADLLPLDERPTVALALASSKPEKNWPDERYTQLVPILERDLGLRLALVGGRSAAEDQVAEAIRGAAGTPPLDLREWDLRRLVFLLERADLLITPDTGPMHVAVALGTPTVSLMGYTNPKRVGPYRFRELIIDAFGEPDEDYSPAAGYRQRRMERITPEQVAQKVELALSRYGAAGNREKGTTTGNSTPEGRGKREEKAAGGSPHGRSNSIPHSALRVPHSD